MPERPRPERSGAGKPRRRGEQRRGAKGKEQLNQSPLLAVVHELVTAAGVRQAFDTEREFHLRLDQEAYMPLVIESWSAMPSYRGEKRHISVAHYYHQGGDTIADPDILMTDSGYPIEIQMPTLYTRILSRDQQQGTQVNTRAKRDVEEFMRLWAQNIRDQGWIEEAKRYKEQQQQYSTMSTLEQRSSPLFKFLDTTIFLPFPQYEFSLPQNNTARHYFGYSEEQHNASHLCHTCIQERIFEQTLSIVINPVTKEKRPIRREAKIQPSLWED